MIIEIINVIGFQIKFEYSSYELDNGNVPYIHLFIKKLSDIGIENPNTIGQLNIIINL